jgi:pilus assembly protein Flp/PilA
MLSDNPMLAWFQARLNLRGREDGAAAIEYGLLAALIALAIIVAVGLLGTRLDLLFRKVLAELPTP